MKHGMMSAIPAPGGHGAMDMSGGMEMGSGADKPHQMSMEMGKSDAMPMDKPHEMEMGKDQPMDMGNMQHGHAATLPATTAALVLIGTFAVLGLTLWITAQFVPIVFTVSG